MSGNCLLQSAEKIKKRMRLCMRNIVHVQPSPTDRCLRVVSQCGALVVVRLASTASKHVGQA